MRALLILSFIGAATCGAVGGPIDFTPGTTQRQLEGIVFDQVTFHQDGHTIGYEPPRGWTYSGSSTQFILTPPKVSQARGVFEQSKLTGPQVFDETTLSQLRELLIASSPPGAEHIQIVSEEANPVRIRGEQSYEIVVTYSYYGEDQQVGVIFVGLDDLQLRFRFATRKEDFPVLYRAFRGSLFTLQWL
jgi:hypothetical protein